jgi:D-alanyl-D-alanine carboxypeptidase
MVRNHNHLLGSVDGVDGIKTGYIHDSGFNIVTSVQRNNRHIVAVIFGGHTAEARDARMRSLIANNINIAATKHTAPPVVEGWEVAAARAKEHPAAKETTAAASLSQEAPPAAGSTEPIKPNTVKTVAVQPANTRTALLSPLPLADRKLLPAPATAKPASITNVSTIKSEPPALPGLEPQPAKIVSGAKVASAGVNVPVPASVSEAKPDKTAKPDAKAHGDWAIQVGAFDNETEARERLNTVGNSGAKDLLSRANPFTERIEKGDKAMYRARFAGLEKSQAETVCKKLKHSEIPCMLLRN